MIPIIPSAYISRLKEDKPIKVIAPIKDSNMTWLKFNMMLATIN